MKKQTVFILIIIVLLAGLLWTKNNKRASRPAPLPETAAGIAIDFEKGYVVEELGDGLYWVGDGTYQMMFLTTGKGVIVVDAPPSMGDKILSAIAEVTEEPITHVIYSHSHADHIAGASIYPENANYIAHSLVRDQLERARPAPYGAFVGGSEIPMPTTVFNDKLTLSVGSQTLELSYKGANHDEGNIFIYAPKQKVLMLIDVVFPGWSPFKDLAVTGDVPAFIKSHDDILSYDFETLITGHIGRLGTRLDVEVQKEYILDIQKNAISALQSVDFMAIAADIGFENPWALFDTYLDALEDSCTKATEKTWIDRLGGVDIFTSSHCAKIIESLRID